MIPRTLDEAVGVRLSTWPTRWDYRWLDMAELCASWSKDPSTKVGAVFVRDSLPLAQGWNGFPRRFSDDARLDARETKYPLTVHAEMNAIYNAARMGSELSGSTLYVHGLPPCAHCALGIIQVGTSKVVWRREAVDVSPLWQASFERTTEVFLEAGVGLLECGRLNSA